MDNLETSDQSANLSTQERLEQIIEEKDEEVKEEEVKEEEVPEETDEAETEETDTEEEETKEEKDEEEKEEKKEVEKEEDHILLRGGKYLDTNKLNEKFPGVLKQFPELRAAIYRDRDYGRIFPGIEDAKEAAHKAGILDSLEEDVVNGNSENFINAIDKGSLEKFSEDFLPKLFEHDRRIFRKVTDPVIHATLKGALKSAESSGNDNLRKSVQHLLNFMHGKPEFPVEERVVEDPKVKELQSRLNAKEENEYQGFRSEVIQHGNDLIAKEILKGLDPAKAMSEFEREAVVERVMRDLNAELEKDPNHLSQMNLFWSKARKIGLSREMGEKIISAFSQAALNRLPALKDRYREQLYKTKKVVPPSAKDPKKIVGSNKPSGVAQIKGKISAKDVDWSKTSTQDYLEKRITLRKSR